MSSRAPVGYLAITDVPVSINQGYIAIRSDYNLEKYYTLNMLRDRLDEIKSMASGTTFPELSKKTFRSFEILTPTVVLTDTFEDSAAKIYNSIRRNIYESELLTEVRNELLPRLISGDLPINPEEGKL